MITIRNTNTQTLLDCTHKHVHPSSCCQATMRRRAGSAVVQDQCWSCWRCKFRTCTTDGCNFSAAPNNAPHALAAVISGLLSLVLTFADTV